MNFSYKKQTIRKRRVLRVMIWQLVAFVLLKIIHPNELTNALLILSSWIAFYGVLFLKTIKFEQNTFL